jgi:hypothetical protein
MQIRAWISHRTADTGVQIVWVGIPLGGDAGD